MSSNVYVIQEADFDNKPPMGVYTSPLAALLNAVKVQSESTIQYATLIREYDLNSDVKLVKDDDEMCVPYPDNNILLKVEEINDFSTERTECVLNLYFYKESNFYKNNKGLNLNQKMVEAVCVVTGFEWNTENFSSETNADVYTISKTLNKE